MQRHRLLLATAAIAVLAAGVLAFSSSAEASSSPSAANASFFHGSYVKDPYEGILSSAADLGQMPNLAKKTDPAAVATNVSQASLRPLALHSTVEGFKDILPKEIYAANRLRRAGGAIAATEDVLRIGKSETGIIS